MYYEEQLFPRQFGENPCCLAREKPCSSKLPPTLKPQQPRPSRLKDTQRDPAPYNVRNSYACLGPTAHLVQAILESSKQPKALTLDP